MANQNNQSGGSTRGGTPEQHAEAGRQSHKNDDKRSGESRSSGSQQGGSTRGGSSDQQGGTSGTSRQSHKTDK